MFQTCNLTYRANKNPPPDMPGGGRMKVLIAS